MAAGTNDAAINFPTVTTGGQDITQGALYESASGSNLLYGPIDLTNDPAALGAGGSYTVPVGDLDITIAATSPLSERGARRELTGLLNGVYVGLLQGGSELSGDNYARVFVAASAWTVT